jgi:hypothetical protein
MCLFCLIYTWVLLLLTVLIYILVCLLCSLNYILILLKLLNLYLGFYFCLMGLFHILVCLMKNFPGKK